MLGEEELFKKVDKVKLSSVLPDHKYPPGQDHAVIDEDKNILNFCSGKYSLVRNEYVFRPIEDYFVKNKIDFIRSVKIINKAKFYVDYIIKTRVDDGEVKGMFPRISVWNSYDGGSMMRNEMGFFRLVGSNTISRPVGLRQRDIYRHATGIGENGITTKEKVKQIIQDAQDFIDNLQDDIDLLNAIANVKATKKKIAIIGKKVGLSKKMIVCAEDRYDFEIGKDLEYTNEYGETVKHEGSKKNLLTVYTSLNYGIFNTNLKELPEKKVDKDRKLLAYITELVEQ